MAGMQIDPRERHEEAIAAIKKRAPVSRKDWDRMESVEREHAFTVANVTEMRVLQQTLDAVESAVEHGTTLEDFKDAVSVDLIESWGGEIPGRLETIFRTNAQNAYSEGRYAINSAPAVKEARPYWRYDDVTSDRECEECEACGGTVLPADDPFWSKCVPPLHFNCSCTITALSPEEAEEEGIDEKGPEVEVDEDFGEPPSTTGKDWEPDMSGFSPELREALEERLRG